MALTFLYHALASGASGQFTVPSQHLIEVQAPSALPYTGGLSSSHAGPFCHQNVVSFASAHSVTTGSETATTYNTLATSTVEKVNILNVVTADRVVARLASTYAKATAAHSSTFAGCHFDNLRIGGVPVEVSINPDQMKSARKSDRVQAGSFVAPIDLKSCYGASRQNDGGIHIPEFGTIYLAESIVTTLYQSISMLRVELGCAVVGHFIAAFVSTNGEPMPG